MKPKWGYGAAILIIFLIVLQGCTSNTSRTEKPRTALPEDRYRLAADVDTYYLPNNKVFDSLEDNSSDIALHYTPILDDIAHLNFHARNDLGFPRIERILNSYEQTIKRYANRYGFDWRLILAVMNQESRFRIQAVSHRGAFGLMQLMPGTGRDVSSALGIEGIRQPEDNIAGGVYYLWRVRSMFDAPPGEGEDTAGPTNEDLIRLSLAAYNGGPTRIHDAQQLAVYLGLDPYQWNNIKELLPMLSRRYYTLHQYVWEDGKPRGGYFYGWPETINYVESVMGYYSYYRLLFNE
jgi:membrane-bound lytic murein transglycosylase MltF